MKISDFRRQFFSGQSGDTPDFGLGDKVARQPGTRLINDDGTFNVVRRGQSIFAPYRNLVQMSWPRFIAVTVAFYLMCNLLFALGFYLIGSDHLNGVAGGLPPWEDYLQCFYFSVQTFTTVGYGAIAPQSLAANTLAALLALFGWVALALVTGLFFARFSRPASPLVFSDRAIVAPYGKGMRSLQFRIANKRDTNLINLRARVVLTWLEEDREQLHRRFYPLPLERDFVSLFPLNWTVVHPFAEDSPIRDWTADDHRKRYSELLVSIEGYDRTYAQYIFVNKSYTFEEIAWGVRFQSMYMERERTTWLYLDRIDATLAVGEEE